mmetsp:Transcript_804/g.1929  ORF Transcript_804/g.1929 Transcript_804/m.1929 type:complete len:300 (-) Transcript_804:2222-3121(-)|eukprot:CAMPEP_0201184526 /NCGR_PEP_ID=MMETSP0851-20130426/126444_1 /ASSEMBLY_ACC=CAM_ASM_000631 /TAXON_ID=183588 /ORGANISM="Pseudo-nitzschia fraudulenta, Strain WWA7" /LENGTH=299 /DNA_ID=CAMNT_0047469517 /DNA_START=115 /DNA_END=1014 /DNA_ORIENTATION=+
MKKSKSFIRLLIVTAACGASNAFAPQQSVFALSKPTSTTSPSSLNVWNPFLKKDEGPSVVQVVKQEPVPGPLDNANYIAGAVWLVLITWAFGFAPGELGSVADNEMITLLVTQPTPRPEGINELWFAVWNCFAVVPLLLGALEAPVGRGQRLPAAPFLFGSGAFGYFSLGPYFATRTVRTEPVDLDDLGWASRNIFESRIFGVFMSAIAISIPFTSDLLGCDLSSTISGYIDLASSSRFVAVASIDITIMSLIAAVLVSQDATRRGWDDKATPLLAASILLPVVTPCLYLAARPSLEEE